jgi:hypothetical protein
LVLNGMEEVSGTAPDFANELEVFAWNDLHIYSHPWPVPSTRYRPRFHPPLPIVDASPRNVLTTANPIHLAF